MKIVKLNRLHKGRAVATMKTARHPFTFNQPIFIEKTPSVY